MYTIPELKSRIDDEIRKLNYTGTPKDLYDPISYILQLEAKRMRPVLVLLGCDLFGGDINKVIMPALGIEVFHNFTLVHDDIMDNAPLRRSQSTVHAKWNTNVAILSGDTMFVKACQLMMMCDDHHVRQVMELFHKTAIEVCEGQQMDMDFEKMEQVSIDDYLTMISYKTAVLLAASLKTGAMIGGASKNDSQHLYEFGRCIGIAFQLMDDILDAFGDAEKFGKLKGGDILANKKTFLLLKAYELATGNDFDELHNAISTTSLAPENKIAKVLELYDKLNVRILAEFEMERYYQEALQHLNAIHVDADRKAVLRAFAEKLMVREV